MKYLILTLVLSMTSTYSHDFQAGDIIFTTYRPCRVCQVIEDESGSAYSHLGIIVESNESQILVADSLGTVKTTEVSEFIDKAAYATLYRIKPEALNISKESFDFALLDSFKNSFEGLKYDRYFLWDNYDENGNELVYCSEFVAKLINPFLTKPVPTKKMNYKKNYDFWVKYFREVPIPQDKPGINPGYLSKQKQLQFIKVLKDTIEE